jgi:hypothetical protein
VRYYREFGKRTTQKQKTGQTGQLGSVVAPERGLHGLFLSKIGRDIRWVLALWCGLLCLLGIAILCQRRFATACGRLTSTAKDVNQPGFAFSVAGFYF